MTATIKSETEVALKSLAAADSQASSLESRLDQLDDKLDALLEQLESGKYGGRPEEIQKVLMEQVKNLERDAASASPCQPEFASTLAAGQPRDGEEAGKMEEAPETTVPRTTEDKKVEKQQHDALLDMMDA